MENESDMLKAILRSSGWSQEQLARKLGVTFATVNAWINGKSKPRETVKKRIQDLYLAKSTNYNDNPIYITLVFTPSDIMVGDQVLLEKDLGNKYDDESILAILADKDKDEYEDEDDMYVANSVYTVARGTWSAGRLYDKLEGIARARIEFVTRNFAIARILDWGMGEQ